MLESVATRWHHTTTAHAATAHAAIAHEEPLMDQIIIDLQTFVAGLNPLLSILAITFLGGVPFVESYLGTMIGAVAGIALPLALGAALLGNTVAILVAGGAGGVVANRRTNKPAAAHSRRARVVARTDKYGVPIASLLAPTVFAISLTTFIMVSVGYRRRRVITWQIIAAVAWGLGVAAAYLGMQTLTG